MTRPTLAIAALAACLFAFLMMCARPAHASDVLVGCVSPGSDGGATSKLSTIKANGQFMVTSASTVNYRTCASTSCTATATDAPISGGAQVDLCMPSGSTTASFYIADGGSSLVCVYNVSPKTVCQIP